MTLWEGLVNGAEFAKYNVVQQHTIDLYILKLNFPIKNRQLGLKCFK